MRLPKDKAMVVAAAVAALASTAMGCGDSKPASPRTAVWSQVGPGNEIGVNDFDKCQLKSEKWIEVGEATATPRPLMVADGDQVDGQAVTVSCAVRAQGDGYYVDGRAKLGGRYAFAVRGQFTASGTQTNVFGEWADSNTGVMSQNDCTAELKRFADPNNPAITGGRVWATVTCPHASLSPTRTCEATAEFIFENCTQE